MASAASARPIFAQHDPKQILRRIRKVHFIRADIQRARHHATEPGTAQLMPKQRLGMGGGDMFFGAAARDFF